MEIKMLNNYHKNFKIKLYKMNLLKQKIRKIIKKIKILKIIKIIKK